MNKLSIEKFNELVKESDEFRLTSFSKSKTRFGSYFVIRKGLLTKSYFVGKDEKGNDLIEIVG